MKSEDQIHFLSELLQLINQLQSIVRDYCRVLTAEEERNSWSKNDNDFENEPF